MTSECVGNISASIPRHLNTAFIECSNMCSILKLAKNVNISNDLMSSM